DEVRGPRPVALEGRARLSLQRAQRAERQEHEPDAERERAGETERDEAPEPFQRFDGLLLGVRADEIPQLRRERGQRLLRIVLRHAIPRLAHWKVGRPSYPPPRRVASTASTSASSSSSRDRRLVTVGAASSARRSSGPTGV